MGVFIPKWCHVLWTLRVSCDKSMESTSRIWELSGLLGLHQSFHTVFLERSTALVGYQKQPQPDSSPYSWAQNIWEGSPRGGVSWPVVCWKMMSADQWPVGKCCQLTSGLLGDGVSWPVVCWEEVSIDQWCLLLLCSFDFSKLSVAKNCFSIFNYKISGWWIPNSSQNCNCT